MLYALLAGGHLSFGFALQAANQLQLRHAAGGIHSAAIQTVDGT